MSSGFMTEVNPADYFDMLTVLRDSGVINMMGAPRYLQEEFGMSSQDARRTFILWVGSLQTSDEPEDTGKDNWKLERL
jgi:hypothetical protein